jgi:hypothetical protein
MLAIPHLRQAGARAMAFVVVQQRTMLGARDRDHCAAPSRQQDQRGPFTQLIVQPR